MGEYAWASHLRDAVSRLDSYHRLVLVVGAPETGKTSALMRLAEDTGWPRVNVGLSLSEKLLELTHRQRAVRVAGTLDGIVQDENSDVTLLDNIELLFAPELAQDPLKLLQSLSRNRTIVAAWPGNFDGAALTYAEPGHPEARRYPTPQAVIVRVGEADQHDIGSPGGKTT